MKLTLFVWPLLTAALAAAAPTATATTAAAPTSTAAIAQRYYNLKSTVKPVSSVNPTADPRFNDLYIWASHIGAGFNAALLLPTKPASPEAYLNDTYQLFDLGTDYPWGLSLRYESYAGWSDLGINVGTGDGGFILNEDGLVFNSTEFGGWLACDWWYGQPELFWRNAYYDYVAPSTCADIYLYPEFEARE